MKPPFRVLYSNDTTNICTCISPFHSELDQPFTEDRLRATVDETVGKGIDVHLMQPGFGEVPWWQSASEPPTQHTAWLRERYGAERNSYGQYMDAGGDMVRVFLEHCQKVGQLGFVSLRINDSHGKDDIDGDVNTIGTTLGREGEGLSQFYVEHLDWRLSDRKNDWFGRGQNWAIPEVRARRLSFIRELCAYPALAGFEFDFMRFPAFFRLHETTAEQRIAIITEFFADVRRVLDASTPSGAPRRWLSARVPAWPGEHHTIGIDLAKLHAVGLDMAQLSSFFFTRCDPDVAGIRRIAPDLALYLEITQATSIGKIVGGSGVDPYTYRRTTPEQFHTAAHRAYARGADGVGAFNFVYYRQHGTGNRGPFHEPPFDIFADLRDPAWLARQPQHWFIGAPWASLTLPPTRLPLSLESGKSATFTLDLAPPTGGWRQGGRLRLQAEHAYGDRQLTCHLNGALLAPTADCSEFFAVPYPSLIGGPDELRAWDVPASLLRDGDNTLEFRQVSGGVTQAVFIDLGVR